MNKPLWSRSSANQSGFSIKLLNVNTTPGFLFLIWSVWSLLNSISLLFPGHAFSYPIFHAFQVLEMSENVWGTAMLFDSISLFMMIRYGSIPIRALTSTFSGVLWISYGILICIGAVHISFFSVLGVWDIICGSFLLRCAVLWAKE